MINTGIVQYRVIRHSEDVISVHQVSTNERGEVIDYVRRPVTLIDTDTQSLTHNLIFILNSLVLPVIDVKDIQVDKDIHNSVQSALDLFNTKE